MPNATIDNVFVSDQFMSRPTSLKTEYSLCLMRPVRSRSSVKARFSIDRLVLIYQFSTYVGLA